MGTANYNAMQVTLKHPMTHGVQFDVNYTFSKSIDLSSDAERVGTFGGYPAVRSSIPGARISSELVSDFDATHQFNANWTSLLTCAWSNVCHDSNRGLDAVIGGWQLSGLVRLTSGFPLSVFNGVNVRPIGI